MSDIRNALKARSKQPAFSGLRLSGISFQPMTRLTRPPLRYKLERMSYQWVKASEIAEYVYCSRAWHLRHQRGEVMGNVRQLKNGRFHHKKHGRKVQKSVWLERAAYALLFITIAAITFQLVGG